jgi:hypothetical protein
MSEVRSSTSNTPAKHDSFACTIARQLIVGGMRFPIPHVKQAFLLRSIVRIFLLPGQQNGTIDIGAVDRL